MNTGSSRDLALNDNGTTKLKFTWAQKTRSHPLCMLPGVQNTRDVSDQLRGRIIL